MVVQFDAAPPPLSDVSARRVELSQSRIGRIAVISVCGEVDMVTSPQLDAAIRDALASTPDAVVVDLSDVTFLASAGLQALMSGHDAAEGSTQFAVVAAGPAARRPIEVLGIDSLLSVRSTLADAISELQAPMSRAQSGV